MNSATNIDKGVIIIRALAVMMIVVHHCLCLWFLPDAPSQEYILFDMGITSIINTVSGLFKTIGLFSFTFISGYLLGFKDLKKTDSKEFIIRKLKRLINPALFFGLVYLTFYHNYCSQYIFLKTVGRIPLPILGSHLWYLPVIFSCAVVLMIFAKSKIAKVLIPLSAVVCYLWFLWPLAQSTYIWYFAKYYPIFASGYAIRKYMKTVEKKRIIIFVIFLFSLFSIVVLDKHFYGEPSFVCCCSGLALVIILSNTINTAGGGGIVLISKNGYGIYLLHQFVINLLCIQFRLTEYLNGVALLFVLFVISISVSLGLTYLIRRTKLKFLIGE